MVDLGCVGLSGNNLSDDPEGLVGGRKRIHELTFEQGSILQRRNSKDNKCRVSGDDREASTNNREVRRKVNDFNSGEVVVNESIASGVTKLGILNIIDKKLGELGDDIKKDIKPQGNDDIKKVAQLLPDPSEDVSPDIYFLRLVEAMTGKSLKCKSSLELNDYFQPITQERLDAYKMEVVSMTRQNNVHELMEFFEKHGRDSLNCVNRFGETLLHMVCRRGFTELVSFFLGEKVLLDPHVRDDFGRTPLHDAMWNPSPQLGVCTGLLEIDPSLLLVTDKRGCTPFQYARTHDWPVWRKFLHDNRSLFEVFCEEKHRKFT